MPATAMEHFGLGITRSFLMFFSFRFRTFAEINLSGIALALICWRVHNPTTKLPMHLNVTVPQNTALRGSPPLARMALAPIKLYKRLTQTNSAHC